MSWTVITPTLLTRIEVFRTFIEKWSPIWKKHDVFFVFMQDDAEVSPEMNQILKDSGIKFHHMCHADIGIKHFPTKCDMVRSWAFYWAYKNTDSQYFLTIDDDVLPAAYDMFEEYEKVFEAGAGLSEYLDVGALTSSGLHMRGYPYQDRMKKEVAVQYGGWHNVLDYDAATQLAVPMPPQEFYPINIAVPKHTPVTCCIMNTAWKREYTEIMWQLPMLNRRYNRVGDIWSGLFIKKVLDDVGAVMVINGKASGFHERASNPYINLQNEAPGCWLNDNLWSHLAPSPSPGHPHLSPYYYWYTECAAEFFDSHDKEYADHFRAARDEWQELFR